MPVNFIRSFGRLHVALKRAMSSLFSLIASLLIALWTGRKPSKRTFEMLCLYFSGWASAEELFAHLESLKKQGP